MATASQANRVPRKYAAICGAEMARKGKFCTKPSGWGTGHPGVGPCNQHGGATPNGVKHSARPSLALLAGMHIDVSPMDALLMCVNIKAAEVAYFSSMIMDLDPDHLLVRPHEDEWEVLTDLTGNYEATLAPTKVKVKQQELNIWVKLRNQALKDLAGFSSDALKAGCEERMVSLAESIGRRIADALAALLNGLALTAEQRQKAPGLVRTCLATLEIAA